LKRRYQRTATTITSVGNRNPANADFGGSQGPGRVGDFTAQACHDLANAQRNGARYYFPGRLAGQPVAYQTLHKRLQNLGFPIKEARITALRQLVLQAPAPVVADALGFHPTTATRQVTNAGGTWSR
jgi:hypothetical protein